MNARYIALSSATNWSTCLSFSPSAKAILRAWNAATPITGSIGSVMILSGVLAATSSISMPPSVLAITATLLGLAIDQHRQVQLARNFARLLQIEFAHHPALRPGLMGHQRLVRAAVRRIL